jgi:hypothetical protein
MLQLVRDTRSRRPCGRADTAVEWMEDSVAHRHAWPRRRPDVEKELLGIGREMPGLLDFGE